MSAEQKTTDISSNPEIYFDWMLTDACNFECSYCHPQIAKWKNRPPTHGKSSLEIAEAFNALGKKYQLLMSGGEPLLLDDFVSFCSSVTQAGNTISMNTNLSVRDVVRDFANSVDPKSVSQINAALHVIERERQGLDIRYFVEDTLMLQEKGFSVDVFYVLYPPLLNRFDSDAAYFKMSGIKKVAGKIFKGLYEGKMYPQSYSKDERAIINGYKNSSYSITTDYLEDRQHQFFGRTCSSGVNFFKVDVNGDVQRCPSNKQPFGNIYDGTFKQGEHSTPCVTKKVLAVSQCNQFAPVFPKNN